MNKINIKLATLLVSSLAMISSVANSVEFRIGAAGNMMAMNADGKETLKTTGVTTDASATAVFTHPSVFAEVSFDEAYGITIGLDYVPDGIQTASESRTDATHKAAEGDNVTNRAQAEFNDLTTVYVEIPVMETGLYLKAGWSQVDIMTKESLGTGSTYTDSSTEGSIFGVGFMGKIDSAFYKLETTYADYDVIDIASSTDADGVFNKVQAELEGINIRLAVGYAF
jgi:hypothetical protein